jgi:CDP-ribitol ribitolphosphotransferase
VTVLEYRLSAALLRLFGRLFRLLPGHPDRIVLASPRKPHLDGNLQHLDAAIREQRPGRPIVRLLEPYSYGFLGKVRYAIRMVRAMYHLQTAGVVFVDNAYLPVHVAPHAARTTVVQVWHAAGALKRFGLDTQPPPGEPDRTFLHRHYDWVVTSGEASREPWSRALRTPLGQVLALGSARTDLFFEQPAMAAARARLFAAYPGLQGRRVILYAPTFRGRGRAKRSVDDLDAQRLRSALGPDDVLVLKSHPNLDPALVDRAGFDVIVDPNEDMNELLVATDILVTDYSSSVFDWALLDRPLVLVVPDLADYERDPGLYVDYPTEMIGAQVVDTAGVIEAILGDRAPRSGDPAFIARHLAGCDGRASRRIVDRFLGPAAPDARLPAR